MLVRLSSIFWMVDMHRYVLPDLCSYCAPRLNKIRRYNHIQNDAKQYRSSNTVIFNTYHAMMISGHGPKLPASHSTKKTNRKHTLAQLKGQRQRHSISLQKPHSIEVIPPRQLFHKDVLQNYLKETTRLWQKPSSFRY